MRAHDAPVRVLVTRAAEDAARTAAKLEAMGFDVLLSPLIETRATGEAPPEGPVDALLVTSAKAAAFLSRLPVDLARAPILAVGERTAEAVRDAGGVDVRAAEGDAVSMIAHVRRNHAPGTRFLHLVGRDRKVEPDATLVAQGYRVTPWVVYEAASLPLDAAARGALATGEIDAVLHYSRRSATLFLDAVSRAAAGDRARAFLHAAISADAAEPLREAGATRLVVAAEPSETALLRVFADAASLAFGARCRSVR
ncbi:uroporphyrinogen-III synthase [Salinarimonas ramus]|uniref:Uroporphyrinogen III methyltransferase n=1 Tax=Salinarimonas ramus TaxID=690164 RepID=A0A917Q626_9HYPH|nr:uroporphyrinogen-III synthase [Salinarimonas ramus]GGK28592.1 uroporphyrinogen III methyltransferase [Salinarimonas ramus]